MTTTRRGILIAIEGIDGSGKSTLAREIARRVEAGGVAVLLTREPTDGPLGRRIRELARSGRQGVTAEEETALFIEDRRDHVRDELLPALEAGKAVILDRYFYSTMAYQGARGINVNDILRRNREFAPEPDLLVLLKLDVEEALERITRSRGDRPDHFEQAAYLKSVALIFDHVDHPKLLALDARLGTEMLADRVMEEFWRALS